jgi:16S rRNA (guanine527-N7)-methyltransferase
VTSREFRDRLRRRARRAGLNVAPELAAQLEEYFRFLALWNSKINLTALALDPLADEAVDRLLVEPLVAAELVDPTLPLRALDLGSGSGSPAIPMALARPQLELRLVESKTRKAVFLLEVLRALRLPARVETARFEQLLARPELHEAADLVTIRAVRVETRTLLTIQAFLKPSGRIFWFRSNAGGEAPGVPPPLRWAETVPLMESLGSRLTVLTKELVA